MRDDRVGHYTVRIADRYKHWTTATYAFSTRHERGVRFNVAYHTHCVSKIEMRYDSGQSQQATIVSSDRIDSMSQHEKVLAHACSPVKRCRSDNTISIFCGELFVSSIRAVRILLPCIAFSFIVVGRRYTHHGGQLPEYLYSLVPRRETEMAFRFNTTTETTAVAATNSGQLTCSLYH